MVVKDYQHLFPDLVSRSRYHRRRKNLKGIQRQFFLSFRLHALVSNQGAIYDFVLSPANVGERLENLFGRKRGIALVCPLAKPISRLDRRGGTACLASRKTSSD